MTNLEAWQNVLLITLETITIMIMIFKIDPRIRKYWKRIPIWIISVVVEAELTSHYQVPFRLFWSIIVMVILLYFLMRTPIMQGIFISITAMVSGSFIQAIMMIPLVILHRTTYNFSNGIIVNSGMLLIVLVIFFKLPLDKTLPFYINRQKLINTLIMIIIVPLVLFRVIWDSNQADSWQYISLVFSGMVIWTLVVVIVFFEILKMKENKKIAHIYDEYTPIFRNLVDEVRTKQHDYNNHIQALYSLAELKSNTKITDYIDGLLLHSNKHELFLKTDNNVISALLYSKSRDFEDKGIQFEFYYDQPLPEYPLKDFEMVEVIGNLLDNARDATLGSVDQKVTITMKHENNYKVIEVSNTGKLMPQSDLNNFFKKGFSTKGKNRGYGLYNVSKTVRQYCGTIEITSASGVTVISLAFL